MLWGIPGTLIGALLAVRLGGWLLLLLGLAAVAAGAILLRRGKALYALPLLFGLVGACALAARQGEGSHPGAIFSLDSE